MSDVMRGLRGATTVETDSPEAVDERVGVLVREMMARNGLTQAQIVSVFLTATPDIRSRFPATAARMAGLDQVALLGAQELDVEGGTPRCIRILMHVQSDEQVDLHHVYLEGAEGLRGDFSS